MTAATKIERSGPAIHATLAERAPAECAEFEAEFRQALTRAEIDFDLRPVEALLDRWWGIAAIRAVDAVGGCGRRQHLNVDVGPLTQLE